MTLFIDLLLNLLLGPDATHIDERDEEDDK
jgi:hypothetical protein